MEKRIDQKELLKRVKAAVHSLAPGAEIILFGSRARNEAGDHSDWDFLILLSSARDRILESQIKDRLYDIELETDTVLTSVIRSKQEWQSSRFVALPLRQQIDRDGVPL